MPKGLISQLEPLREQIVSLKFELSRGLKDYSPASDIITTVVGFLKLFFSLQRLDIFGRGLTKESWSSVVGRVARLRLFHLKLHLSKDEPEDEEITSNALHLPWTSAATLRPLDVSVTAEATEDMWSLFSPFTNTLESLSLTLRCMDFKLALPASLPRFV